MNVLYELLYLVGIRPWERGGIVPALRDLIEGPDALAPGRALDIGCGTGGPAVYLAAHGWEVTAVDVVARALAQARKRAAAAGVNVRFVHGDVTRLGDDPSLRGPYRLLLDAGCYHGLEEHQRDAYARLVREVSEDRAALLLFALSPGGCMRPRSFRGASEQEIRSRFGAHWELAGKRPHPGKPVFRGAEQSWYLLRRRAR